jgi:uncharacterized HAD superfamily protein
MNIGIDVDGVLADVADYQLRIGAPYFKEKFGREIIDPDAFDVRDIYGCTEDERKKFGWDTIWEYIIHYPARENASQVIRKLKDEGNKIYLITGRVYVTNPRHLGKLFPSPVKGLLCLLSRTILKRWLKRNKIPYDGIHYCSEHYVSDKYTGCRRFNVDVMIDDKAENINALSKMMNVICFDAPYNKNCEGENIMRAKDWVEVYALIKEISG